MNQNDVYAISDRMKNLIAMEGMNVSPVGIVLVNIQTHFIKKLYDFSARLARPQQDELNKILEYGEDVPRHILSILTPELEPDPFKEDEAIYCDDEPGLNSE